MVVLHPRCNQRSSVRVPRLPRRRRSLSLRGSAISVLYSQTSIYYPYVLILFCSLKSHSDRCTTAPRKFPLVVDALCLFGWKTTASNPRLSFASFQSNRRMRSQCSVLRLVCYFFLNVLKSAACSLEIRLSLSF